MKPNKNIIRIVLSIIVAAFGAWQLQGNNNSAPPQHGPRPIQGQNQGQHQGQGQGQHQGQKNHQQGQSNNSNQVGDFDYYLVSLSWSPSYCLSHPNDQRQCGGKGFGFVLHGVWPQKQSGGYPENCPATSQPSASAIQKALAFMPSEKLIQHEWSKHGTCSGFTADEYLSFADKAFASLKIPKDFDSPGSTRSLSAEQISNEFLAANPGLNKDSLTVSCSGSELQEVRLCVDKQLKPMSCGKGVRTQCSRDTVQIRAVR
jgi:ribonuclease T2